jgi:tetratricopeptide (TPR) repeat protein
MMKKIACFVASVLAIAADSVQAANFCGELTNAFGPFDYRKRAEFPSELHLVESAHFTAEVAQGIKGNTGNIGADLDYTLRAWPNHPQALAAISKVALRGKTLQVPGAKYPAECYFERAARFAPDDGAVHAVYASHLYAQGKTEKAFAEFKTAVALDPEDPTINYNVGLGYFKKKDYENASKYAKKAYALGFPLQGLKNRLVEAGKWDDKAQ